MGKDHHSHHAPVIANADCSSNKRSSSHHPSGADDILAGIVDDEESACRGCPASSHHPLSTTAASVNHSTGHGHGHGPATSEHTTPNEQAASYRRVASPVLSRDYALLDKAASNNSVASSTAPLVVVAPPAARPSILRNAKQGGGGNIHEHGNGHQHGHGHHRGRETTANTAVNANPTLVAGDAVNGGSSPSKVNFSPLANPRINKALKSLVRSSSEPGMSRNGNAKNRNTVTTAHSPAAAVVGVGAQLATVGTGTNPTTVSPLTPVTSAELNEKEKLQEDEKAGMQGSKVFTVGDEGTTATQQPASAPATRRGLSGLFSVGGNLPLARSSEPYLPSSRSHNGIFDDEEAIQQINNSAGGAYPPPPIGGSAPGIQGASGGAGAPTLTFEGLLEPEKPLKPPPTWKTSMMNIVKYSWLNLLLIFIPVSFACHFSEINDTATFCVSFAAIIPLAALLGFATEELALRVGHTLGGLLNATFGNTVELIIAILALVKGELRVVQAAMIGSILSNCLLVLGCCFFAGGIRFHEQIYTIRSAQLNISLLGISALVIVIPAAFNAAVTQMGSVPVAVSDRDILKLSRGVAFILLFVYAAYLFFQFWTHSYLYRAATTQHHRSLRARSIVGDDEPQPPMDSTVLRIPSWASSSSSDDSSSTHSRDRDVRDRDVEAEGESRAAGSSSSNNGEGSSSPGQESDERRLGNGKGGNNSTSVAMSRTRSAGTTNTSSSSSSSDDSDDEEHETPKLKVHAAIVLILVVTAITGVTAEWLVDSIDGVTATGNISKEFVALILLPLVGNVAEHVTAVTVSVKDKLDLSMAVAVGSSIQISLFVIPILVLLGWCIGQPLTLEFDILETIILFVSIIIVNQAISDGKTNWMEGAVLISTYVTIALAMWFYPGGSGL